MDAVYVAGPQTTRGRKPKVHLLDDRGLRTVCGLLYAHGWTKQHHPSVEGACSKCWSAMPADDGVTLVIAESTRQLQFEEELRRAVREKRAVLALSAHAMRGIRPTRIIVVGYPRGMSHHDVEREVAAIATSRTPAATVEWR